MARKSAREAAIRLVYQRQMGGDGSISDYCNQLEDEEGVTLTKEDIEYVEDVVQGVFDNISLIDQEIEKYSLNWTISRMSKVDASVLRVAAYEVMFRDDIPYKVTANEAVGIAKLYSGEKSSNFVNGVLGKLITENEKKS